MNISPRVTAVMLTYGSRKNTCEETIESFLRQDYQAKTLLIVNTHPDRLFFEAKYDNIGVLNVQPDFPTLADASHFALSQVETPLLCIMDDDDIFLPWHISQLVEHYEKAKKSRAETKLLDIINPRYYEIRRRGHIRIISGKESWKSSLYERPPEGILEEIRRHPKATSFYDGPFRANRIWQKVKLPDGARPSLIQRIGVGVDWTDRRETVMAGKRDIHKEAVYKKRLLEPWRPHWDRDYIGMAEESNADII